MPFQGDDRFQVLGMLGEGGMGLVYEAYDRVRQMRVALKTLRRVDASRLFYLKREFRALADLAHPNIVSLYELIAKGDEWFFSMELVDGCNFLEYIQKDTSTFSEAIATLTSASATNVDTSPPLAVLAAGSEGPQQTGTSSFGSVDSRTIVMGPLAPGSTSPGNPIPFDRKFVVTSTTLKERIDVGKFLRLLRQLARALTALHSIDMVHRDLKPANILVTDKERLVLMDFGLAVDRLATPNWERPNTCIGTPAYMAPEQIYGATPDAAVDWYAFGVIIYRALTGLLPFAGSAKHILESKLQRDPEPPSTFVTDVPESLQTLCLTLLARDPSNRPEGSEVLAVINSELKAELATATRRGMPQRAKRDSAPAAPALRRGRAAGLDAGGKMFVGRIEELNRLREWYAAICRGSAACVVIEGQSGMGKSCLVAHFLEQVQRLRARQLRALTLQGRCNPQESVPYKAFDGVIDDLCIYLLRCAKTTRKQCLTRDVALLARIFPVLSRIPEIGAMQLPVGMRELDIRKRAVVALRTLLSRLGKERPIIIHIEDIQWADSESLELLRWLCQRPAPRRTLVLATRRTGGVVAEQPVAEPVAAALMELRHEIDIDRIAVERLPAPDLNKLVARLSVGSSILQSLSREIWQETGGMPMLVIELARFIREMPDGHIDFAALRLEDILCLRIDHLPAPARALIEMLAIAGGHIPLLVLCRALSLEDDERERTLSILRIANLVRLTMPDHAGGDVEDLAGGGGRWLDVYHDKVREALMARIDAPRARTLHRQLAVALEKWHQAPVVMLAQHWLAAGDFRFAGRYLLAAADNAMKLLALEHAMDLYAQATSALEGAATGNGVVDQVQGRMLCRAYIGLAKASHIMDRSDAALDALKRAEPVANRYRLSGLLADIWYVRGNLLFPQGDLDGCLEAHERARRFARDTGSHRLEARALGGLGDAFYLRGRIMTAYEHFARCIHICGRHQFTDIEVENTYMRGIVQLYRNRLNDGLRDGMRAAEMAERIGHSRAELIARSSCIGWILYEMKAHNLAKKELLRGIDLAREIKSVRFQNNALLFLSKIELFAGRRAEAEALAREALAACRESGFAFSGPMALAALAMAVEDGQERQALLDEGVEVLQAGSPIHNHAYFCRDAMDAVLAAGKYAEVERYAAALTAYTSEEPLPWSTFFVRRGRALAAYAGGDHGKEVTDELRQLWAQANAEGFMTAAVALGQALSIPPDSQ